MRQLRENGITAQASAQRIPLHFSFSNHFQSVPKHGSVPKECKLDFDPPSANSFSNLERSELTRFRDRAGQRWKANAGPCFPAKGANTGLTNSAPSAALCQWRN